MAPSRIADRDGNTWMVALLVLSLAVLAALAWQAYDAARSHQEAATDVLRDYANLAADELVGRCTQAIGYFGAYPFLQQFVLYSERSFDRALPTAETLAELGDPRVRSAAKIVATTLRLDLETGAFEMAGKQPSQAVEAWLRTELADPDVHLQHDDRAMGALATVIDGQEFRAYLLPIANDAQRVYGFLLDRERAAPLLAQAVLAEPLLPPTLGAGSLGNDMLSVALVDSANVLVFKSQNPTFALDLYRPEVTASRDLGVLYSGLLEGWRVQVTLDPEAAPRLVIGGLPRSRLPMLAGLIVLGVALLVAALVQQRRARRLTRLREDFIAEVSHELRTPLTQIRMFTETLLLGRVRSEAEARQSLEIVDREARRLGRLVENILLFSRGQRGSVPLACSRQPIAPIVLAVVDELAPMAEARVVSVHTHLDEAVAAEVDTGAIHQVMINLLDNAIKYGPRGQRIDIAVTRTGGQCLLTIDDQGPGVPARDRLRIWQSYRRLERDRRAAIAGTGIGLAVVRDLVERHGGTVEVGPVPEDPLPASPVPVSKEPAASEAVGARFAVVLPIAPPLPTANDRTTADSGQRSDLQRNPARHERDHQEETCHADDIRHDRPRLGGIGSAAGLEETHR